MALPLIAGRRQSFSGGPPADRGPSCADRGSRVRGGEHRRASPEGPPAPASWTVTPAPARGRNHFADIRTVDDFRRAADCRIRVLRTLHRPRPPRPGHTRLLGDTRVHMFA